MVDMILEGVVILLVVVAVGVGGFMALICIMSAYFETKDWFWWKVTYLVHERTAKAQKIIDSVLKESKKPPFTMPQMRYAGGERRIERIYTAPTDSFAQETTLAQGKGTDQESTEGKVWNKFDPQPVKKREITGQQFTKLEALAKLSQKLSQLLHTSIPIPVELLESFNRFGCIPSPSEGNLYTPAEIKVIRHIWVRINRADDNREDKHALLLAIKEELAQAKYPIIQGKSL
jgi:hypothetical protein